ncbi:MULTISPECIES: LacI family DNA-binding transcriptional regulator [unclassified Bifidobacterium]|uniref:LacI family DNA-binding transcriptional regulator n=1 Tax=unclassified Bifidobacterium TaxID=2608897 RepID=UPI00112C5646|nr:MULTISPECIES: LacI family DNA-binding transcriptional regulator [unclassified Bifidobacterium]TPF77413.1 LacI family transcriptional regulator [Bifidobacterium sp. UTCIF-1]TPF79404.1 LacI family transcriptional regulator [Bifidobacterium sp. UTCIF-24]TPF81385.1 LacI family transcriptional regulator [Bifidobacterium sp. UTCIF-3]TPF83509.1 LacI family transcriptional regulator [Bifidobacterium sp. UTCIF-36]TPF88092.1 LacI family transcriptional regulator [Bifidobacterium sp. UTBIF-56]
MVTMKEIAHQAGVSVSTVSLVLNNRDEGRVRGAVARHVRDIAAQLGYKSNPLASSLRTGRTHMLGFISEDVATTPYAGGIILGAQRAARRFGYMLIVVSTDGKESETAEIAALKRYGADGFLYAKMSNRITHAPSALTGMPLVLVDATDADGKIPSVEPDEFRIGYDATKRLIDAGCERIAYVGCSEPLIAQAERLRGYQAALEDDGRKFDRRLTIDVLNNDPALAAVDRLFNVERPDGFFCFNDARAWYVYECAARRGLTVGRDISVVGVDNHRVFAETLAPTLTTVELPHFEMGYWAVTKLVSMLEDRPLDNIDWPRTTAPMPRLDSPTPAKIHCTLVEKHSVRQ